MRVGYDAKRIFNNFTGLGNYGRTLLENLQQQFPAHEYHLYTPKVADNPRVAPFLDPARFQVHQPAGMPFLWRSMGIKQELTRDQIQLYHGLSHELPIGIQQTGIRSVVTIHDLIFHRYPEQYAFLDRHIYSYKFKYACQHADRIVAISESTKRDIVEYYGIPMEKISVIYQACDPTFQVLLDPEQRTKILAPYSLPEDYLLYVGSLIERKGLHQIVEALRMLPASLDIPLIIVGQGKAYRKRIAELVAQYGLQNRVLFRPEIPFTAFPALYQAASTFLYPSLYEGFGIPVVEALWSRTPVIASDRSSLPEAGGPDSWYVNPEDPTQIAHAIEAVLGDAADRSRRIEAGHAYVQRFEGKRLAAEMMALYEEVLG